MRVLIVGAGIGGLTLAALLRRRGLLPVVIDRAPDFAHGGYMLGLYPLGSRIFHGLGLHGRFVAVSDPMAHYRVCNGHGDLVHAYDLAEMTRRVGEVRLLSRPELLELLQSANAGLDLRMKTGLVDAHDRGDRVAVRLSDHTELEVDLLVGADGMHSQVREEYLGGGEPFDTHWGAWVWWADKNLLPHDTVTEYWGAGRFVGVYPTKERLGVIAGGPTRSLGPDAIGGDSAVLKQKLGDLRGALGPLLDGMPADPRQMFYWKLSDVRAEKWHDGRIALLGDSACGFLPTAGIGASMAMESAAALADELDRADAATVPRALKLYEKRRKPRAEAAQANSRQLAKMMFVESLPLAWGRDQMMKFYTLDMLIKQIAEILETPM